jgi:hypothetical protein
MKLSTAIRIAATRWYQAFGSIGDNGSRCTLAGAAEVAHGSWHDYRSCWLEYDRIGYVTCPRCLGTGYIPAIIVHLNDAHKWSREAIASWVEQFETAMEETAGQPVEQTIETPTEPITTEVVLEEVCV